MIVEGWRAHLSEDAGDWARMERRLTLYRRRPDGSGEQVVGWDESGTPEVELVEPGALLRPGFRIPAEALPSLRDAIEPGPSAGEVRRLEEALKIERGRVDRSLAGSLMVDHQRFLALLGLDEVLRLAGNEWGPLGVAKAAAGCTDQDVLVRHLTEGKVPAVESDAPAPEPPGPSDADLLARMGVDAAAWTDEFLARFSVDRDENLAPADQWGLMIGWFANAIEAGRRAGREEGRVLAETDAAAEQERVPTGDLVAGPGRGDPEAPTPEAGEDDP